MELSPHHFLLLLLQKFCCMKDCCQNIRISLFQVRRDFLSWPSVFKVGPDVCSSPSASLDHLPAMHGAGFSSRCEVSYPQPSLDGGPQAPDDVWLYSEAKCLVQREDLSRATVCRKGHGRVGVESFLRRGRYYQGIRSFPSSHKSASHTQQAQGKVPKNPFHCHLHPDRWAIICHSW